MLIVLLVWGCSQEERFPGTMVDLQSVSVWKSKPIDLETIINKQNINCGFLVLLKWLARDSISLQDPPDLTSFESVVVVAKHKQGRCEKVSPRKHYVLWPEITSASPLDSGKNCIIQRESSSHFIHLICDVSFVLPSSHYHNLLCIA